MKLSIFLLPLLFLFSNACYAQINGLEYVTLTNPEGKKVEAILERLDRDYVTMRLKGSSESMRAELSFFSEASQRLINDWARDVAVMKDLEFGFSSKRFDSERSTSESRTWRDSNEGYSLRVTNDSNYAIDDLKANYILIIKRETMGRTKASDHTMEHVTGSVKFPTVLPYDSVMVETKPVKLREEELNGGWYLSSGGQEHAEDKLEGIIVEYFYKDRLIASDARPNTLLNDYTVEGPRK